MDDFEKVVYGFLIFLAICFTLMLVFAYVTTKKATEQCNKYGYEILTTEGNIVVCYEQIQHEEGYHYNREIRMLKEWKIKGD